MRKIIFLLMLFPAMAFAQKQYTFLKLNDASGKQINGDATLRGFERQLGIFTLSSAGKNNTQLLFTMPVTGASADLKRVMASGELLSGLLTVTQNDPSMGKPMIVYTIKMEGIHVTACSESMGCNAVTTTAAVLTATRIGWTYYQTAANGVQTVSRKFGYDADSGKEWTNF